MEKFSDYIGSKPETRTLNAINSVLGVIAFVGVFVGISLYMRERIRGNHIGGFVFNDHILFPFIVQDMFLSILLSDNNNPMSLKDRFRLLKTQPKMPYLPELGALILFNVLGVLAILSPSYLLLNIVKDLSYIMLIGSLIYRAKQTCEIEILDKTTFYNELYFGITIFWVFINNTIFAMSQFFPEFLRKVGLTLELDMLFLSFLYAVILAILYFMEEQKGKELQFSKYETSFTEDRRYQSGSFAGFIAKLPSKLAKIRYHLNIAYAALIVEIVFIYIYGMIVLNAFTYLRLITLIVVVLFFIPIYTSIYFNRQQLSEIMGQYSTMMDHFEESNSELLSLFDLEE